MTSRQFITPDNAGDVPPHPHDASEISGELVAVKIPPRSINGLGILVASATTPTAQRRQAQFKCDGTDDHETWQAALDALPTEAGTVIFLEGTYNLAGNIAFPDKPVVLLAMGKATLNCASGTTFTWVGDQARTAPVVMDGFAFTGGAAGMNLISPKGDFWFVNNVVDTFTVKRFITVENSLHFARTLILGNLFRDVVLDFADDIFNATTIVRFGGGGSRGGEGVLANNYFKNITGPASTTQDSIAVADQTDRPMIAIGNMVEDSTGLDGYFKGNGMSASHNVIDGVMVAGTHDIDVSELGDVTITSIASGEILKWDGAGWINNTLAEAGISATAHTHVEADIADLDHNDLDAIHDNVAAEINALTLVTAANGDVLVVEDASDSFNKKKVTAEDFLSGGGAAAFNELLLIGA